MSARFQRGARPGDAAGRRFPPVDALGHCGRALLSVAAAEALTLIGWQVVEAGGRVGSAGADAASARISCRRAGRARGMLDVIGALVRAHRAALDALRPGAGRPPLDAGPRAARPDGADRGRRSSIASGFDTPGPDLADRRSTSSRAAASLRLLCGRRRRSRAPAARGVYPVRLPDGTRTRVQIDGQSAVATERESCARHSRWPSTPMRPRTDLPRSAGGLPAGPGAVTWPSAR